MARLTRRTLLADLGRATLGAVVLGPTLAGCAADGGDAEDVAGEDGEPDDGSSLGEGAGDGADGPVRYARASFGFVSAYVLVRDGEALVFDTGTGDDGIGPVTDALTAAGVGWDAVGHVLVSHDHGDHVGGLELVAAEAPEATVYAGMPDLDTVRDRVAEAREVADGDELLGLQVVATPGHTPGHVSALAADAGVLLVGDALVNSVTIGGAIGDGVELSPPEFTADADAAAASGQRLAELSFDVALFGHGEPITAAADAEVAAAVAAGRGPVD